MVSVLAHHAVAIGAAILPVGMLIEAGIGVAVLLTLVGVRLCWQAPRRRMSLEERAKDGKLTEDQARRRIRCCAWLGPVVTVTGMVLLVGLLLR